MRLLDDIRMNEWGRIGPNMRDYLSETQVIVCDQVTQYYFEMNDKEYWDVQDFPNLFPPFKNFWLETHAPTVINSEEYGLMRWSDAARPTRWGALFIQSDNDKMWSDPRIREFHTRDELTQNVKLWLNTTMFIELLGQILPYWCWATPIQHDGIIWKKHDLRLNEHVSGLSYSLLEETKQLLAPDKATPQSVALYREMRATAHAYIHPLFLSISFMHARNITLTHHEPSRRMNRKQERAGRPPMLAYKILEVGPIKKIIEAARQHPDTQGKFSLALHRCIGHFKTFTPEKPLLGKHVGTYFWNEQWRGKVEDGHAIRKDYVIKSPK